ncbi:hypothetical protein [Cohnella herbarum]|uniref:Matrixin family metalloprotease n=1 Tax=Cohnella herbarum TaxID=2728023 RepID=A0A7Z2VKK9_9BACL|nr:hypothetical protein [Cohnella herbarum]QJD84978.1 hypothetical protein HH215_18520 [Cohnella herbarum]
MKKRTALIFSLVALSVVFSSIAFADVHVYKRNTGYYSAYYDSSIASYGYTSKFDWARSKWTAVSPNLYIGSTTTNDSTTDEYYVGTTAEEGLFGRTSFYYRSIFGNFPRNPDSDNWDYSVVSLYDNTFIARNLKTDTAIKNTATHEVGHSVGLEHTTSATNKASSVMTAGNDSLKDRTITTPSSYDLNNITTKWGSW